MFDSDKLENKAMTHKTIFVKNNGNANINGLPAGNSMPLRTNAHGQPLDQTWRRLTRRRSGKGVLQLSDSDPSQVEEVSENTAEAKKSAKVKETKSTKKGV